MEKTIWEVITERYFKIEKRFRICFWSAIVCGFLAHIYAMTNHLYNYDELWHTPTGFGTGIELGRWSLSITVWLQKKFFKDAFTIPFINGLLTIVFVALVACFTVAVLDIKDEVYAVITGALIVTFPAIVSRMFYMFTTHYYAMGLFMVALGTWIFVKKKRTVACVLLSVFLVVYGVGIYQSNFVTAVCLLIGYLMVRCLACDEDFKALLMECISSVLFLGLSMVLYLVGNKAALFLTGRVLSDNENMNTLGKISVSQLLEGLGKCYKTYLKIPFIDVYSMNPTNIVRITFLIAILVTIWVLVRMALSDKNISKKILFALMVLTLPVAVNLIIIMAISSGVMYSIMIFEIVYMLIIPITCIDNIKSLKNPGEFLDIYIKKISKYINILLSLFLILTIITYIWFANGNYLAMEYTNKHDEAYYTALMTQIKSVEGYTSEMPVVLVGRPDKNKDKNYVGSMIGKTFNIGGKRDENIGAYSTWHIMSKVIGYDPVILNSDEDEAYFNDLTEVKEMPSYPTAGSIKIIDGAIVVKF